MTVHARRVWFWVPVFMLALPGLAFGGFFDKVKGAAGITPNEVVKLTGAEICPRLAEFAGTPLDPFAEKPLEYTKVNIPQVDDFTVQVAKLTGTMTFAQSLTDGFTREIESGTFEPEVMKARLVLLGTVLADVALHVQQSIAAGQALFGNLAGVVVGPNVAKLKPITESVKGSIESLTGLPEQVKNLLAGLTNLTTRVTEASAAVAADVATEAAEAATVAAAGAVEAATEAAEGATEAAAGVVEAATEAAEGATEAAAGAVEAGTEAAEGTTEAAKDATEAAAGAVENAAP